MLLFILMRFLSFFFNMRLIKYYSLINSIKRACHETQINVIFVRKPPRVGDIFNFECNVTDEYGVW